MKSVDPILDGSLGLFWRYEGGGPLEGKHAHGYIKKVDGGEVEIQMLADPEDDLAFWAEHKNPPRSFVASTPEGAILVTAFTQHRSTRSFGGYNASVTGYRARAVICNIGLDDIVDPLCTSASAEFPGLQAWSDMSILEQTFGFDQNKVKSSEIQLKESSALEKQAQLGGGLLLFARPRWGTSQRAEQVTVSTALEIGCRARRPKSILELVRPIERVQELLSLAWNARVAARPGRATLSTEGTDPREPDPLLWYGPIVQSPPDAVEPNFQIIPLFTVEHLAGFAGVARWVKLCNDHPRAVAPVTDPLKNPNALGPTRIRDVAAGIEYWVALHRRAAAWTKKRNKDDTLAHALARRVGSGFDDWIGGADEWAARFWSRQNALKHDPAIDVNFEEIAYLAATGRVLLMCALLDRIAGSKRTSRSILQHHQVQPMGRRMREILDAVPAK